MDIVKTSTKSNKILKKPKQLKNKITEIKTHTHTHTHTLTLEGSNIRLYNTEEQISDLEDRVVKITQAE